MCPDGLAREIHSCAKCSALSGQKRVVLGGKKIPADFTEPPENVSIMFVAESPSTSGTYFYNNKTRSNLRRNLLNQLFEAKLIGEKSVRAFNERGYYLADTVKCPFEDPAHHNAKPPPRAIENCRPFLIKEISLRRPKVICALGKSALRSLAGTQEVQLRERAGETLRKEELRTDLQSLNVPILAQYYPGAMVDWAKKLRAIKGIGAYI